MGVGEGRPALEPETMPEEAKMGIPPLEALPWRPPPPEEANMAGGARGETSGETPDILGMASRDDPPVMI